MSLNSLLQCTSKWYIAYYINILEFIYSPNTGHLVVFITVNKYSLNMLIAKSLHKSMVFPFQKKYLNGRLLPHCRPERLHLLMFLLVII